MLFGFAIRAIYVESSSMFVRGGVYRVVHEALGGALAKLSVSALMFDYVVTGPISAVSAGLYLAGLINETASYSGQRFHVPSPKFAAGFAVLVTIYFWRQNTIGIRESSDKALTIIKVTSVMVVILIIWCLLTVFKNGFQPVPLPTTANLHFGPDRIGLARRYPGADDPSDRLADRPRTLAAGHEWLRNAGAGLPRDRSAETQKPAAGQPRGHSL